jgi:apolipoprotein N-acyltransferase
MAVQALAIAAGATLYALALPPFDLSACGWIVLVPLLLVVREQTPWRAFGYGIVFGSTCAWTVGWWLPQAGVGYLGMNMPAAILGAYAYAIVCWGTAFGIFAAGAAILLRGRRRRLALIALPALWVGTELFRARVVGQPWGLLGYTQHAHAGLIQIAAVTGVYGLSFLLALVSASVADAVVRVRAGRDLRATVRGCLGPACLVGIVWTAGIVVRARGPVGGFGGSSVAVIQAGVMPSYEWTRAYADRQINTHLRATSSLGTASQPRLIVWPEHAVPRYLEREPMLARQLGNLAIARHADLLLGVPRFSEGRSYNSVRLFTADGRSGGHYDKQRLVPFAEATPFMEAAAADPSGSPERFSSGTEPGVLRSFVLLGVSICHEILYPELVGRAVRRGAKLLVNLSNDGWLDGGYGTASRQHFAMAVFRAVEARRYLVRAATTGVSAIVDPYGQVINALRPGESGVLSAPVAGRGTITFYVRYGDAFGLACALLALAAIYAERPALAWRRPRLAPAPV